MKLVFSSFLEHLLRVRVVSSLSGLDFILTALQRAAFSCKSHSETHHYQLYNEKYILGRKIIVCRNLESPLLIKSTIIAYRKIESSSRNKNEPHIQHVYIFIFHTIHCVFRIQFQYNANFDNHSSDVICIWKLLWRFFVFLLVSARINRFNAH